MNALDTHYTNVIHGRGLLGQLKEEVCFDYIILPQQTAYFRRQDVKHEPNINSNFNKETNFWLTGNYGRWQKGTINLSHSLSVTC